MEMIQEILAEISCPVGTFQFSAFLRMVMAAVCGGFIGFERELKGKPAGIKTFALVCMGATLAMVTNEYITVYVTGGTGDAARMAAQVISGIGFLGAGTIMVAGANQIKGLTTAAALWVTASLGITIGCGFYSGAVIGAAVVMVFSFLFTALDKVIADHSRYMRICIEGMDEDFMKRLLQYFEEQNIQVKSLTRNAEHRWYEQDICVIVELDLGKHREHGSVLTALRGMEGLRYLEEI